MSNEEMLKGMDTEIDKLFNDSTGQTDDTQSASSEGSEDGGNEETSSENSEEGSTDESSSASEGESKPVQQAVDEFEVPYIGKVKKDELVEGYMRNSDYLRRVNDLQRAEKDIERERERLKAEESRLSADAPLAEKISVLAKKNEAFREELSSLLANHGHTTESEEAKADPHVAEMMSLVRRQAEELEKLKNQSEAQVKAEKNRDSEKRFEAAFEDLKKKGFRFADLTEVKALILSRHFDNIVDAVKHSHGAREKLVQEHVKSNVASKNDAMKKGTPYKGKAANGTVAKKDDAKKAADFNSQEFWGESRKMLDAALSQ